MRIPLNAALAVLLAVGLTGFVVAPARAVTRLSLSPSQSDVIEGEAVTFRGRASESSPGAVVALQRRVAGEWTRVDRIRLRHRDRFRFTTVPPRGRQRYRVRMLRQSGARLSPSPRETVRVHWRPDLNDVTAAYDVEEATGDVHVEVSGLVAVPDGTVLLREELRGETWVTVQTTTVTDHRWREEFTTSYGTEYRHTLPVAGLRLETSSPAMRALARDQLPVDLTTDVAFPTEHRHLSVVLEAGQTYTYSGPYWVAPLLADPTGHPVPAFDGSGGIITFRAETSGTYALDLKGNPAEQQPARLTLSRPVEVATTLDAGSLHLVSSLPNQLVDLSFDGEPGEYVSQNEARTLAPIRDPVQLLAPNGEVVAQLATLPDRTRLWKLPEVAGRYTLRVTPANFAIDSYEFEVLSVVDRTMPLNGDATSVDFDRPGRIAVLDTPTPAGADVSFTSEPWRDHLLLSPDGTQVNGWPSVAPTEEGRYRMIAFTPVAGRVDFFASTPEWFDASIDGPTVPFDLGPAVTRDALLRIPATSGDLFSVSAHYPDGSRCVSESTLQPTSSTATLRHSSGTHPAVVIAEQTGTVVVRLTPCQQEGWFSVRRITPVTMEWVYTRTYQARATFAQPGDVAMLLLDAGPMGDYDYYRGITFSRVASDLTNADRVTFAGPEFVGTFDRPFERLSGLQPIIFWGGPRATGWVDIRATG